MIFDIGAILRYMVKIPINEKFLNSAYALF